jgi:hypothetical protein
MSSEISRPEDLYSSYRSEGSSKMPEVATTTIRDAAIDEFVKTVETIDGVLKAEKVSVNSDIQVNAIVSNTLAKYDLKRELGEMTFTPAKVNISIAD